MLTLMRMAGWDYLEVPVQGTPPMLFDPSGTAIMVPRRENLSRVQAAFNEFLRFKEYQ